MVNEVGGNQYDIGINRTRDVINKPKEYEDIVTACYKLFTSLSDAEKINLLIWDTVRLYYG